MSMQKVSSLKDEEKQMNICNTQLVLGKTLVLSYFYI